MVAVFMDPHLIIVANSLYLAWVCIDLVKNYLRKHWQWFMLDFAWLVAGVISFAQGMPALSAVSLLRLVPLTL